MAQIAGNAVVNVSANTSMLHAALKRAEKAIGDFGARVGAIGSQFTMAGTGILSPIIASVAAFTASAGKINDMSKAAGVSVETFQRLSYAADQSGVSAEQLASGINKSNKLLYDAATGGESARKAFEAVGLSVERIYSMSPEDRFAAISEALNGISDPAKRSAAAMSIFGKSGTQLLPMMSDGAAGIKEMTKKAEALGGVMSGRAVAAGDEFGDVLADMNTSVLGLATAIATAVVPTLTELSKITIEYVKWAREWIQDNQDAVKIYTGVGVAIAAIGVALVGLSVAAGVASTALGVMNALLFSWAVPIAAIVGLLGAWAIGFDNIASAAESVWAIVSKLRVAGISLGTMWEVAKSYADDFFDGMRTKLIDITLSVKEAFTNMYNVIISRVQDLYYGLIQQFPDSFLSDKLMSERDKEAVEQRFDEIQLEAAKGNMKYLQMTPEQQYDAALAEAITKRKAVPLPNDAAAERSAIYQEMEQRKAARASDRAAILQKDAAVGAAEKTILGIQDAASRLASNFSMRGTLASLGLIGGMPGMPAAAPAPGADVTQEKPSVPEPSEVMTTFSGRALSGFAAGGTKLEQNSEKQVEILGKINRNIEAMNAGVLQ